MSSFAVIHSGMMPVRRGPAHQEEMINMLLFGDLVEVLESAAYWHNIRSCHDGYEGWINSKTLIEADEEFRFRLVNEKPVYCFSPFLLCNEENQQAQVTFGSRLPLADDGKLYLGSQLLTGNFVTYLPGQMSTILLAHHFLGTPYLWGGRSIFGIDCSGFTQQVYAMQGIALPRDAWQQAEKGETISNLEDAKAGDLVFFAEKEKISHVGILTGDGHILHASGQVRKDRIDHQGIFSSELKAYTLPIKSIKRYGLRS